MEISTQRGVLFHAAGDQAAEKKSYNYPVYGIPKKQNCPVLTGNCQVLTNN